MIDQVVADFTDDDRCRRECLRRADGLRRKACIHPSQVAIANEAFLPSSEEIDRARRSSRRTTTPKHRVWRRLRSKARWSTSRSLGRRAVLAQADDDQPPSGRHSMSAFRTVRHTRTSSWLNTRCSNVTTPWFGRDDDADASGPRSRRKWCHHGRPAPGRRSPRNPDWPRWCRGSSRGRKCRPPG